MKTHLLFLLFCGLISGTAFAQRGPQTNPSHVNQQYNNRGNHHAPTKVNHNNNQRTWVPGQWSYRHGHRHWVNGYWQVAIMPTTCAPPPPVYTAPPAGMNDWDFNNAVRAISSSAFDAGRLSVARQVVRSNYVSSMQVREMMGMLAFDDARLELAKTAYANTVDKQHYYLVNDRFAFSSSVVQLEQFLAGCPVH